MGETIRVEVLVEKNGSICDESEALQDGDKKAAGLKNGLDIYVGISSGHAKSANVSYDKMSSDPEAYTFCTEDTGRKINGVGANSLLEMKENLKEKCKQTWATYDAFKSIKGSDYLMTQKYLTKWVTYQDLYQEFFGEEVQY